MAKGPRAVLGGTFDKFHRGHEKFLRVALKRSGKLLICITSDEYAAVTKVHPVEPYCVRWQRVRAFVDGSGYADRAELVRINDAHGPAAEDAGLEALFVTSENRCRGEEINEVRRKRGLRPLELIEIPLELADDGMAISATRIREGLTDSGGRALRH
jgi:pantetheine-phosphate adenylyltransferase